MQNVTELLLWVNGYSGGHGNEEADELVRHAAGPLTCGPEPILTITIYTTAIKSLIKDNNLICHTDEWVNNEGCRQGSAVMATPCRKINKYCLKLSTPESGSGKFWVLGPSTKQQVKLSHAQYRFEERPPHVEAVKRKMRLRSMAVTVTAQLPNQGEGPS